MKTANATLVIAAAVLCGCSQLKVIDPGHQAESREQVSRVDQHSSFPAVRRTDFEQINLIELVDPNGKAAKKYGNQWRDATWGVKYDLVLATFRESTAGDDHKRQHRDSVQDRILGVSTSRCNVFKTYLRRQQTEVNFWLGSAVTVAGVLGSILPGQQAARNLAGTAGILSGIDAEYNQQFFSGLAAQVIVQGIETRQNRMLQTLVKERKNLSIAEYSMEAAIKDAVLFDGTCSTVTGLMEASGAIREVTNPGLPHAAEVIAGARALREVMQAESVSDLSDSGKLQKLLKLTAPATSAFVVSAAQSAADDSTTSLTSAAQAKARINAARDEAAAKVAKAFTAAQAKLPKEKQSKLTADGVKSAFSDAIDKANTVAYPIDKCVAALTEPAGAVGAASAKVSLTADNTPERLKANAVLEKAKADAAIAVAQVELLVRAAVAKISAAAEQWLAEVTKETIPAELPKVPSFPGLAQLCA